jgi:Fe-S cluster assembly protein SufD
MSKIRRMETAAEKAAADQFAARSGDLPGSSWVREMRSGAIARFAENGLPHRRIEEWKYTDLRAAVRDLPAPAAAAATGGVSPETLAGIDAYRITIVDGGVPDLPDAIAGVEIEPLEAALARGDATFRELAADWPRGAESSVLDLNTAFMRAGVVVRVTAGTRLDKPVHVAFVTASPEPATAYVRNVLVVEDGAAATFVESYRGAGRRFLSRQRRDPVSRRREANVTYVKVLRDGDSAVHLATVGGEVGHGHATDNDAVHDRGRPVAQQSRCCVSMAPTRRQYRRRPAPGRRAACRHDALRRPQGAVLRQPRAVQDACSTTRRAGSSRA